ncbi:retrovirus-related pol polyprotein from transposon TNT 1-94 [Tanacetum coccineum]
MEQAVEQHRVESKTFEVKMNQALNENERLLEQVMSKDIVNLIVNSSMDFASVNVHECEKCLKLETELQKDFVEKEIYDKLFKRFTTLEKHCISLEVDTQLNQEIFQRDNSISNQSAPSFDQLFELNELKAQSQEKDMVIKKLKERIKSLSGNMDKDKIKQDLEEIETINIELDHRVTKLIAENEHLKQTYKQLYDSIKPARKSFGNYNSQDELRKLKGKDLANNEVTHHPSDPEINTEPITPKLLNKRSAHSAYIKHTQEEAAVLRDLVDHIQANYPLDPTLESALKPSTSASGSKPSGNTKKDRILQTQSSTQKNKVEVHPRKVKSSLKNKEHVVAPKGTAHVQHSKLNGNSEIKYVKCNSCMLSDNHDLCVLDYINNVNARAKSKSAKKQRKRKVWKPTGKMFTTVGYIWRSTSRTFTIVGNVCPLTRITTTTEAPLRKPVVLDNETSKPAVTLVYSRKPRNSKTNVPVSKSKVVQIVLWYLDSGCSKHMTGDRSQLTNFVNKFLGTVKFGNDHVAKILGYGDYQIGNVTISRVYYVEGLGHNLFSVGQFCDSNLEVAFRQHTCFIHNLEGVDLLTGSRGNNLYTLSLGDMMASSPICLLSKASKTKSWLWHQRLSHLNFGAINHLARHGLVQGLPKLKFRKDHLCSACAMGKSKKKPHKSKSKETNQEKLYLLHMDLCGPMRVASVNGRKYILVIVDDYSRFTWVKFLRSKDEAPYFIIKFLKMIQLRLKVPVRRIRTDNGTEIVNQTLREYYENVGISYETSVAHSPQQNGVVERRNRMLIEAARTMLIYAKALLFLWAKAVATAFFKDQVSILAKDEGFGHKYTKVKSSSIEGGLDFVNPDIRLTMLNLGTLSEGGNVESQRKYNHSISNEMGMARTKFGRLITKDIENMTIARYMEYEAEIKRDPWGYAQSYTRSSGSTTLERKKDPNDFNLSVPNSHHEDEEVSFDEDVDEWLNAEMSKRINGKDKEKEEDDLIDILKTVVEECNFTLPCTIGNLKLHNMADLGAGVNVMPKSLFEHLKLAHLKETSMVVEMTNITKKAPLGIMENYPSKAKNFNPLEIENDVFSYDSPACLLLEQGTPSCSEESIDSVVSSHDMQELEVAYFDPDLSFCSGYDAIYGQEESGLLSNGYVFEIMKDKMLGKWRYLLNL